MLKFRWRDSAVDYALWNSNDVEDINLDEFTEMLEADAACQEWESDTETHIVE
jgi:hypothetical protein